MENKYIVPPRLNRKQIVYGFTVWEAVSILFLVILAFISKQFLFAQVAAVIAALSFRPRNGDVNAKRYLVMLFRYYKAAQVYCLRECYYEDQRSGQFLDTKELRRSRKPEGVLPAVRASKPQHHDAG